MFCTGFFHRVPMVWLAVTSKHAAVPPLLLGFERFPQWSNRNSDTITLCYAGVLDFAPRRSCFCRSPGRVWWAWCNGNLPELR